MSTEVPGPFERGPVALDRLAEVAASSLPIPAPVADQNRIRLNVNLSPFMVRI